MIQRIEPYRFFFPIGWLAGLLGVGFWIPWFFNSELQYPGTIHPEFMFGGFFLIYAFGFLTTAIPRFTATEEMTSIERWVCWILLSALVAGMALRLKTLMLFADLLLILFVMSFAYRRLQKRNSEPPASFAFVGIGLLLAILGIGFQLGSSLQLVEPHLLNASRPIFFEGFMLSLVVGIGSRLIPGILGHQPALVPQPAGPKMKDKKSIVAIWLNTPTTLKIGSVVFVLSFVADLTTGTFFLGDLIRALVCAIIGFRFWKIHHRPKNKGFMPMFLWISAWSTILSLLLVALIPEARLHVIHLLYISSFGLMTLMISTRVTLSHSGRDLKSERTSKSLLVTGAFVLMAALARSLSYFLPNHYSTLLLIASSLWCLGLLSWLAKFGSSWLWDELPKPA